jgi:hypothetical protein
LSFRLNSNYMEGRKISPTSRFVPFGITFALLFIVCVSTLFTFIIPPAARGAYYLLTGPFNVAVEGDGYQNIVIMLAIVAFSEFYFKARGRQSVLLAALACGAATTYIQSVYLLINSYGVVVTGTSMLGLNVMIFLIASVGIDAVAWLLVQARRRPDTGREAWALSRLLAVSFAVIAIEGALVWLFLYFYIIGNQAASIHEWGIEIAVPLIMVVLGVRSMALRHKKQGRARF